MNPLLTLTSEYSLRWRNQSEDVLLYDYNAATQSLVSAGHDDLLFIEQTGDELGFLLLGNYVLFLDSDGVVSAGEFSERTRPNVFPRVDFVRTFADRPEIIASLAINGRLYTPKVSEAPVPESSDKMLFFGDKIAFTSYGLFADRVSELGLAIIDESQFLITSNDEDLLII